MVKVLGCDLPAANPPRSPELGNQSFCRSVSSHIAVMHYATICYGRAVGNIDRRFVPRNRSKRLIPTFEHRFKVWKEVSGRTGSLLARFFCGCMVVET